MVIQHIKDEDGIRHTHQPTTLLDPLPARDLRPMARSLLLSRRARIRPYLDQSVVREWLEGRPHLRPRAGVKLWLLLTLELWLRANE